MPPATARSWQLPPSCRQKEQVGNANQLLVQHNILQREFEGNQQLYQSLMQRLKDATVSAGLRSTNIHLVDTALAPMRPSGRKSC